MSRQVRDRIDAALGGRLAEFQTQQPRCNRMKDADFDKCAEQLRALADPLRLQLVYILFHGSQTAAQLCEAVALETASVSHHLDVLIDAGIVLRRRESRKSVYSLNPVVAEIKPQVLKLAHVRITFTGSEPCFSIVPPAHPWQ